MRQCFGARPLLLCLGLLLIAHAAGAQPTKADQKRGEGLYYKAKAAQKKGRCGDAIPLFGEALSLLGNDLILFDLAQCLQSEGRATDALHHYLLLNARAPSSPLVAEVNAAVIAIESADERAAYDFYVAYGNATTALPPETRAGEYAAAAAERQHALEEKHPEWRLPAPPKDPVPVTDPPARVEDPPSDVAPNPQPRAQAHPGRTKRLIGLGLGVTGLGAAALGGYYGVIRAGDLKDQASECATDPTCSATGRIDDLNEQGASYNRRGYILAAVGGAAIIGGTVLYISGRKAGKRDAANQMAIIPSIAPGGGVSMTLTGGF